MKKLITSILFLGLFGSLMAQGIQFREDSWKELLAMAKKENKLIFIDNYTSWCVPCKKMVKEIFPLKEVGDFYNANFICCKIDVEKGEGVEIGKKYSINSFPTYLYIDGNGKLYYRSGSYMPAEKFIAEGKIALEEFADKRTTEEWEKLYLRKKNDPDFMKAYINKRNRVKADNADLQDQYVRIEKEKKLLNAGFLKPLLTTSARMNAGNTCSSFLLSHWNEIIDITGTDEKKLLQIIEINTKMYSMQRAIREKNKELFEEVLKLNDFLSEKTGKNKETERIKLSSQYYAATDQQALFEQIADKHADILFAEEKEILKRDAAAYQSHLERMIANPSGLASTNAEKLAFSLKFAAVNESSSLSYQFQNLAAHTARISDSRELLTKAATWAMESVILFDNFSNYETLAEVLYKLGNKKEALWQIKKAIEKLPQGNEEISERVKQKYEKIKNNQL